jgi:biotin carboxyl carrier protein
MQIEVTSELGANVWKVLVVPGQKVESDETLIILECMKMEVPVLAPSAGTVVAVAVAEGDAIDEGAALVTIEG